MPEPHRIAVTITALLTGLYPTVAWPQDYPSKPIRLLTSDAGSGSDYSARVISQGISASLGQQIIVDNRGGIVAQETVARSQPDGYTLLFFGSGLWLLPLMRTNLRYDMARDYAPVVWATTSPTILVVHPSVPAKSVKELINLARAKPGGLNYAAGAPGTINQLAAEMLKSMARVNIVGVSYKGPGAALSDLLGGHVQMMFVPAVTATPHVKSGKLAALAVTSGQPFALLPGLPTVAEAGALPGYEAVSVNGVFAPAKTPPAIIHRINREIVRLFATPEVKEKFANAGVETVGGSPEQFAAKIKSQTASMGKVIKEAGIRDE